MGPVPAINKHPFHDLHVLLEHDRSIVEFLNNLFLSVCFRRKDLHIDQDGQLLNKAHVENNQIIFSQVYNEEHPSPDGRAHRTSVTSQGELLLSIT